MCTASSNILNMIPGYSRDVTDVIKGNVLFFIQTSGFLPVTVYPRCRPYLLTPCLCHNLSFDSNESKTEPFDYRDTLGVGYRESACVM